MRAPTAALAAAALLLLACSPAPSPHGPSPTNEPEAAPAEAAEPAPKAEPGRAAEAAAQPPAPDSVRVELRLVPGLQAVESNPQNLRRSLAPAPPEGLDVSALPEGQWLFGRAPLTNTESVAFAVSADRRTLVFDGNRDERLEPAEQHSEPRRLGAVAWHERLGTTVRRTVDGQDHEESILMAVGAQLPPRDLAFTRLDAHLQGVLQAGEHSVRIAVVDRTFRGYFTHLGRDRLLVDVDGDGRFATGIDSHERYRLGEAVPLGERDLVAKTFGPLGRSIVFEPSEKPARRMTPLDPGHPAPELSALALDGSEVRLAAHEGSWVLVDFWATWCGPCLRELPHLKELQAENPELVILGISGDRQLAALERFLERDPLPWVQVYDEGAPVRREWRVRQLPTNYLIAPDGTIAAKNLRGSRLDERFAKIVESWTPAGG